MPGKVQGNRGKGKPKGAKSYATRIMERLEAELRREYLRQIGTKLSMKRCCEITLERLGGADWLEEFGRSEDWENRRALLAVFGKQIPFEVQGQVDQRVHVSIIKYTVPKPEPL